MQKDGGQNRAVQYLYPPSEPFDRRMLDVGDGHAVYVEQCGCKDGVPVIVFHGGPGGGCSPAMRRYFDPTVYRIILFDQRGCGRSRPHATVENNTTWHLIRDIEKIRTTLDIENWVVFGGSWGATLGLIYAQSHPDRVIHLVLRGVFLATQKELDWFYQGGAGAFWPEAWENFSKLIPADEQDNLIAAYSRRLFCNDIKVETMYARAWVAWENSLASIDSSGTSGQAPAEYARAFARLENHYFRNAVFLEKDGAILQNVAALESVPGTIVQGRYDMICPPTSAYQLSQAWAKSKLKIVTKAGHALSEPGISAELVSTMNDLRHQLS